MKLSKLSFDFTEDLIAQYPLPERSDARLMVVNRQTGTIQHHHFKDILELLESGDVLLGNNSLVFPAFLVGYKERTKSEIHVLLLRELDPEHHFWDIWIEPARKIRVGNKVIFQNILTGQVIDHTTSRGRTLKFLFDGSPEALKQIFYEIGKIPIPKYLKRGVEKIDEERYNNIYATEPGSVIAPAAGFHFSRYLWKYLELKGVQMPMLTLHISLSQLKRLESEDLKKCKIHSEYYHISEETAKVVTEALQNNRKVCVIGTSTLKALESSISHDDYLAAGEGWTNKLIYPPYQPIVPSMLLTNFHLPRTIDFVNTIAFAGPELGLDMYETAVYEGYRFGAYGDSLLIIA